MAFASITLPLCDDCCGEPPPPVCLDSPSLDLTFSDTSFCYECDILYGNVTATTFLLDGVHTIPQDAPGGARWSMSLTDAFSVDIYSEPDCTGDTIPLDGVMTFVVTCSGGLYYIQVVVSYTAFNLIVFEAFDVPLGATRPDDGLCGGLVTLSE